MDRKTGVQEARTSPQLRTLPSIREAPISRSDDYNEFRRLDGHVEDQFKSTLHFLLEKRSDLNLAGKVHKSRIEKSHGGYSDVYTGWYTQANGVECKVAVKKFRTHIMDARKLQKTLAEELYIWSRLNHPRILPLVRFYIEEDDYPYLVSKWMDNGTALKYLEAYPGADVLSLVTGIAEGIHYLHLSEIVHSDIKPDNVLISDRGDPLLCDFGVSRMLAASQSFPLSSALTNGMRGTIRYTSKETLLPSDSDGELSAYSKEADVWAFGMTVYTLLMKKPPYYSIVPDIRVILAIIGGMLLSWDKNTETWPSAYKVLQHICESCWAEKLDRMSMGEILGELYHLRNVLGPQSSKSCVSEYKSRYLRRMEVIAAISRLTPAPKPNINDGVRTTQAQFRLDDNHRLNATQSPSAKDLVLSQAISLSLKYAMMVERTVRPLPPAPSGGESRPAISSGGPMTGSVVCATCSLPVVEAYMRALDNVWHLSCFKCKDCDAVILAEFFPVDGPDGKQQPLCERDYFLRLNLICTNCGQALKETYITACNKNYHVEHFTCSACPTVFGPQESYYEHENDVYCHLHYSIRFAPKCAGCNSAILKQFVEINRNSCDEFWHPTCYMINKFWCIRISSRSHVCSNASTFSIGELPWSEERERPQSLKSKQLRLEQQADRIWGVLSKFEESSAACISDMLKHDMEGHHLEILRTAERLILHVEVLFATIDDLYMWFSRLNLKGKAYVREARSLFRKIVDIFTLLSKSQEGHEGMPWVICQEYLNLVTSLGLQLRILTRIALTSSLKLERDRNVGEAMTNFLNKLHLLVMKGGNPSARRLVQGHEERLGGHTGAASTQGVTYGYSSLAPENAGWSPFNETLDSSVILMGHLSIKPPDLCVKCETALEELCVRLGTYQRWHSRCLQCVTCGRTPVLSVPKDVPMPRDTENQEVALPEISTTQRPRANAIFSCTNLQQ